MKTVAIVQARVGSSRLPMKSLLTLRGHALVDWVVARVLEARRLDTVVVACPDTPMDDVLVEHLDRVFGEDPRFALVRGSENDVLARFLKAARTMEADRVVRVCADNPLVWGEAIDRLVEHYEAGGCDYCYNHIPRGNLWPDGLGAEMLDRELLETLGERAEEPSQREHCLNYIWDNSSRFSIRTFDPEEEWLRRPEVGLDVDTPEDFRRLALLPISIHDGPKTVLEAVDAAEGRAAR